MTFDNFKKYKKIEVYEKEMLSSNGLARRFITPFTIPSDYNCFEVVDKGKAFLFCLNNGNFIKKPELLLTLSQKLLKYKESHSNHKPSGTR